MPGKTDQQRLTDTLTLLQNTTLVNAAVRANAHQLAQDYVNTINPALPAYNQLSQSLSLGFHLASDPNQLRRMARALFLLWKAMHHYDNAFTIPVLNIAQINMGTVQRTLTNYLCRACCVYEGINGGNVGASYVLTQLFQPHPLQFLGDNKVYVMGTAHLAPGQGGRNVLASNFLYNALHDRYDFTVHTAYGAGAGAATVQVESVTAFHWTDQRYVPRPAGGPLLVLNNTNFNQMTGIELSGVHMMVTTQFTGCAFSMAQHAGHMYCAHVSPAGVPGMAPNTDGNTLATRVMATNGAFANAGGTVVRVYGRGTGSPPNAAGYDIGALGAGGGSTHYMTIVGFPGGVTYNIYSQTMRNALIVDTRQIY